MAVVGEAEIIITANTAGFERDMRAQIAGSSGAVAGDAKTAGEDIGSNLGGGIRSGVKGETSKVGDDIAKDGEAAGGKFGTAMETGLKSHMGGFTNTLSSFGVPAAMLSGPALIGVAVAAVGAASLDMASKFQSANATIAASAGISVDAATKIGKAFLTTAGQSDYSATQMSVAFGQVAGQLKESQGSALTAAQSLTFMTAATQLARASGIDLATATTTIAGALQAFQLKASDATKVSNLLFNASSATGQGVDTLAGSLEQLRSRLGATTPSLSSLTALMVDMTKNGITGRSSLMAVNGAVTALGAAAAGTTKAGQLSDKMLKAYGLSATDAQGKLTSMSTIIDKLGPKYATMTQAQQIETSTLLFGSSAAKGMTAIIDAGTKSYDNATEAVNKNNAVQTAAQIQAHTLSGEFDTLKSTVVDFGTQIGTALIPILTDLLGAFNKILPVITDVIGFLMKNKDAILLVAGVITATYIPAMVRSAAEAVTSGAIMAGVWLSERADAIVNAGVIAASWLGIGTASEAAAGEVVVSAGIMETAFAGILGPLLLIPAAIAAVAFAADKLLHTGPGQAVGHFLTAGGQANPINDLANTIAPFIPGVIVNPSSTRTPAEIAKEKWDIAHPKSSFGNTSWMNPLGLGTPAKPLTPEQKALEQYKKLTDEYINPPSTTKAPKAPKAPKVKATDVVSNSDITALASAMMKAGIDQATALSAGTVAAHAIGAAAKGTTAAGKEAEDTLRKLGATAKGPNGTLASMSSILTQLSPKFKDMTKAQQDHTAALIVGKDAAVAFADAVDEVGKKATKTATATKAAAAAAKTATEDMDIALQQALYNELMLNQGPAGQAARAGLISSTFMPNAPYSPIPGVPRTTGTTGGLSTGPHATSINIHPGAVVVTIGPGHDNAHIESVLNDGLQRLTDEVNSGISSLGVSHV